MITKNITNNSESVYIWGLNDKGQLVNDSNANINDLKLDKVKILTTG